MSYEFGERPDSGGPGRLPPDQEQRPPGQAIGSPYVWDGSEQPEGDGSEVLPWHVQPGDAERPASQAAFPIWGSAPAVPRTGRTLHRFGSRERYIGQHRAGIRGQRRRATHLGSGQAEDRR